MMSTEQHNREVLKLWEDALNKAGFRSFFCIGMKENVSPKVIYCGDVGKKDMIEFLRMTADMLEKGEMNFNKIGVAS